MSLKAGFKAHPDETEAGLLDECDSQLLREKVLDPVRVSNLSFDQRKGAVRVFSFAYFLLVYITFLQYLFLLSFFYLFFEPTLLSPRKVHFRRKRLKLLSKPRWGLY